MNQRKLIGALSIVLLAILFITIGCGDGQHRQSTNPRKKNPVRGKGANGPLNPREIEERQKAGTQISQELAMYQNGQSVATLDNGEYILEEIISNADYFTMRTQDNFNLIRKSRPQFQGGQMLLNAEPTTRGVGLTANNADPQGREVLVPAKVTVINNATPSRQQGMSVVFGTRIISDAGKMKLDDQFPPSQNPNTEIAIVDILQGDGVNAGGSLNRVKTVSGGKEATATIIKLADGRITLKLTILEKGTAAQTNNSSVYLKRTMMFVYKVTRPAATAAPAAPTAPAAPAPAAPAAPAPAAPAPEAPAAPAQPAAPDSEVTGTVQPPAGEQQEPPPL